MPIMRTKSGPSTPRAARLFHALSDETRLRVLARLADGERCVCELTDSLDAGQSRLSFHLKTLREVGLVTDRRDGKWIYYTLNPAAIAEAAALIDDLHVRGRRASRAS